MSRKDRKYESDLYYLGKVSIESLEGDFDKHYDQYREAANQMELFGEIKFVIYYDNVWVYVTTS
jgi:hypothetical protein